MASDKVRGTAAYLIDEIYSGKEREKEKERESERENKKEIE